MKSYKDAVVNSATDLLPIRQQKFSPKSHGRVPLSVSSDKRLNGTDVRVFAGISSFVFQGNVCRESYAEIGSRSGASRQQVARAVANLIEFGHVIAANGNEQRQRGWLILPQLVFGQKQRAGVDSLIVEGLASAPRKRLATVRTA